MNIPSPSVSLAKALSKSWEPKSTLQSVMESMKDASDAKSRSKSDTLQRPVLDPFAAEYQGHHYQDKSYQSTISTRSDLRRRISLGDALGPNFGGKSREESETESVSSLASLITKKRINVCTTCGVTDTPSWRRSKDDSRVLLCNACGRGELLFNTSGLRNRSVRKRHKSEKKSQTAEAQALPPSPHAVITSQLHSPVDNYILPLSPLSPMMASPINLFNQNLLLNSSDPLSMLFWDDLTFDSM